MAVGKSSSSAVLAAISCVDASLENAVKKVESVRARDEKDVVARACREMDVLTTALETLSCAMRHFPG